MLDIPRLIANSTIISKTLFFTRFLLVIADLFLDADTPTIISLYNDNVILGHEKDCM